MANELFVQSKGFAALLKQYKGIDYQTCAVEELANGYCDATDNGDELDRNLYISGLILRYWYVIKDLYRKSPNVGYTKDDFFDWLYEALEYACKYRAWRNPAKKVKADQCIKQCIETIRSQHYYQMNLQKNKGGFNTVSLDATVGDNEETNQVSRLDMITNESVSNEFEYDKSSDTARNVIQYYINKDKLIEAIVLDTIAFNDSTREHNRKVTTTSYDENDEPVENIATKTSYSFWEHATIQSLRDLPTNYEDYFVERYDVKQNAIKAAIQTIRKANNQKLYKYLRACLKDCKAHISDKEIGNEFRRFKCAA